MKIEYISIHDLKPYENNPRKNSKAVDKVIESITAYGFKNPILIDENNIIIAGHTRYKASLQMGMTFVPCIQITDLTEDQKKGYRIADNRTNEFAEWDYDLLKIEIDGIEEFTGFEELDLLDDKIERKDLSDNFNEKLELIVKCETNEQLEELYNRLTGENFSCRILTL